ncbi:MAG: preprotein translocase subunit YajC [Clostridia bacterium]|nr:preprotein translocase subunit YajC [Clostridia bacterium]
MATINGLLGGSGGMILYFVVIIAVFYFLLIRPQKKREKEAKNMMEALKKGDRIVTIGGFYGRIVSVKDDVVVINLGGDNKVKIEKSAVRTVVKASDADEEDAQDDAE